MIPLLLWLWISITINSSGATVSLQCTFTTGGFAEIGGVYMCSVSNLMVTSPNENVTGYVGNHLEAYNNDGVLGLNIGSQTCNYFPTNIDLIFKNLEALQIHNSGLLQIKKSDLRPFVKLRVLRLRENSLQVLEKDLFMYNTQLQYILVNNNKIKHIDADLLTPMPKLSSFDLRGNVCINMTTVTTTAVATLRSYFEEQCQDENVLLIDKFKSLFVDLPQLLALFENLSADDALTLRRKMESVNVDLCEDSGDGI